jgi:hypothetical protein
MIGSYTMMIHAYIEAVAGSYALGLLILSFVIKAIAVFSFLLCPLKMLWVKRKLASDEYDQ